MRCKHSEQIKGYVHPASIPITQKNLTSVGDVISKPERQLPEKKNRARKVIEYVQSDSPRKSNDAFVSHACLSNSCAEGRAV